MILQLEKIKYPELVYSHFSYRDTVDYHNSSRMFSIVMEETWKTTRCSLWVFCFLLVVTQVNCQLVLTNIYIYNQSDISQQDFWQEPSREFLYSKHLCLSKPAKMRKSKRLNRPQHWLVSLSKNRTVKKTAMVYCKTTYIQFICSYGGSCTYCPCSPGKIICAACFAFHVCLLETQKMPNNPVSTFQFLDTYGFSIKIVQAYFR